MVVLRALRKNKFKTFLIFMSMTISITSIMLISSISAGIVGMYSSMLKTDGDIIVTQKGVADTFFSDVNNSIAAKISKFDGVRSVYSMILGASPVEKLPIVAIYGVNLNKMKGYELISGRYPIEGEAMLGSGVKNSLT